MKAHVLVVSSAAAIMMMVSTAHGFAYTNINKCRMLIQDFDQVSMLYPSAPNADAAGQLRADASTLCAQGNTLEGVARIEEAFAAIGITPNEYESGNRP